MKEQDRTPKPSKPAAPVWRRRLLAGIVLLLCLALVAGLAALLFRLLRPKPQQLPTWDAGIPAESWGKNENGVFFSSNGEPIAAAVKKGIDVSHFQGEIDWEKAKASGIDFAIIRCGYGSEWGGVDAGYKQDDTYWRRNADECTRLGIPFGTYLYSYATTEERARREAAHVARLLGLTPPPFEGLEDYTATPYKLDYPVYYDLEDEAITGLTPAESAALTAAFFDELEKYGYTGQQGVYASLNWVRGRLQDPGFDRWRDQLWIARFGAALNYDGPVAMWQSTYTEPGEKYGVQSETVDVDFILEPLQITALGETKAEQAPALSNDTRRTLLCLAQKNDRAVLRTNEPPEENGGRELVWVSSDTEVATVTQKGEVRARAESGSCTVTAATADGRLTAVCTVYVGPVTVPVYVTGALAGRTGAEAGEGELTLADVAALRAASPDSILLDAGNSLQGTRLASLTGGMDMAEAFGDAGYDLHAIGGQDLAFGIARLQTDFQMATGYTVAANLRTAEGVPLLDRALSWNKNRIGNGMNSMLTRAGHKIGVFALTAPPDRWAVHNEAMPVTADLARTASEQTAALYGQGAEAILCILAAPFDPELAAGLLPALNELGVTAVLDGGAAAPADPEWSWQAGQALPAANGLDAVLRVDLTFTAGQPVSAAAALLPAETLLAERETMTGKRLDGYDDMAADLAGLAADDAATAGKVLFRLESEQNKRYISFGNYVAEYYAALAEADRAAWEAASDGAELYALAGTTASLPEGDCDRSALLNALPAGARVQLVRTTWAAFAQLVQGGTVSRTYLDSLLTLDSGTDPGKPVCLITDTAALAALDTAGTPYTVLRDYGDVYWNIRMDISDRTGSFKNAFTLPEAPKIGAGRR